MPFYTHDNVPDSPINNFATLNPLGWKNLGGANSAQILSEGNLKTVASASQGSGELPSILPSKTGINKVYFEARGVGSSSSTNGYIVILDGNSVNLNPTNVHRNVGQNEIVSWVIDVSEGKLWIQSNGNWSAARKIEIENGQNPDLTFNCTTNILEIWFATYSPDRGMVLNFGQDPTFAGSKAPTSTYPDANGLGQFHYEPPAGALALCTANLPEGYIKLSQDQTPSDNFKAVTWQNTNSDVSVPLNFEADLIWVKDRDIGWSHRIQDSLRGWSEYMNTNGTGNSRAVDGGYTAKNINSSGFTFNGSYNSTSAATKMVAWCWRAAGSPADGQAKIINEDGSDGTMSTADLKTSTGASITPSKVSANRQNGFSIVKYTGTGSTGGTVPHGLDKKPDMVIIKNLDDGARSWNITSFITTPSTVLTADTFNIGSKTGGVLGLNYTNGGGAYGIDGQTSGSGQNHIAYCWHSVEGYSKCGIYTGNGSADGPMVYCGFRPAFVMIKGTNQTSNWTVLDAARGPYNVNGQFLAANLSNDESYESTRQADFLSNGFKIRGTSPVYFDVNSSSGTYIFMAFAEQPFSGPSNAR